MHSGLDLDWNENLKLLVVSILIEFSYERGDICYFAYTCAKILKF